jgi:hypothetical protein
MAMLLGFDLSQNGDAYLEVGRRLGRIGFQRNLAQEALSPPEIISRPTALCHFHALFERLPRLVVLSGQPVPFA